MADLPALLAEAERWVDSGDAPTGFLDVVHALLAALRTPPSDEWAGVMREHGDWCRHRVWPTLDKWRMNRFAEPVRDEDWVCSCGAASHNTSVAALRAKVEAERDTALDELRKAHALHDADSAMIAASSDRLDRMQAERDAAVKRAAKLATVARGLGEALEAVESAAAMTQAHEMGVLPYETSASTAALAWERADRLRAVALAAWRELEGA